MTGVLTVGVLGGSADVETVLPRTKVGAVSAFLVRDLVVTTGASS
jgi:hypothetical protein